MADIDWSKPIDQQVKNIDWSKPVDQQIQESAPQEQEQPEETGWGAIFKELGNLPARHAAGLQKYTQEKLPQEWEGIQHQLAVDPFRAAKTGFGGLIENIQSSLNAPGNIRDYLARKKVIPESTPALRVPEVDTYKALNLGEKQEGDELLMLSSALLPFVPKTAKLAGKATGKAINAAKGVGELTNEQLKGALERVKAGKASVSERNDVKKAIKSLEKEILGSEEAVREKTIKASTKLAKKSEKIGNRAEETGKKVAPLHPQSEQEKLSRQLLGLQEDLDLAKTESFPNAINESAKKYSDLHEHHAGEAIRLGKEIESYAPRGNEEPKGRLIKELHEAHKATSKENKGKYTKFGEGKDVKAKPKHLVTVQDVENHISKPQGLSKTLQRLIKERIGSKKIVEDVYNPNTMTIQKGYEKTSKGKATVNDYIELEKEVLSEAHQWGEMALMEGLSPDKKTKLGLKAKELNSFAKEISNKIKQNLTTDRAAEYAQIKHEWRTRILPVRNKAILKNATSKQGTLKTEHFAESLSNENIPELTKHWLEDHPKVRNAMAKHDLRNLDVTNITAVKAALHGDKGRALPANVRHQLEQLLHHLESVEHVKKAQGLINKNKTQRILQEPELKEVFIAKPELKKHLAKPEAENNRIASIEKEIQKIHFDQQRLKQSGLNDIDITNPDKLEAALNSPEGKALLPEKIEEIKSLIKDLRQKDMVDALRSHLPKGEMAGLHKTPHINQILKEMPELAEVFKDPRKEKARHAALRREMKRRKLRDKEIEDEMKIYSKIMNIGAHGLAMVLGPTTYLFVKGAQAVSQLRGKK